MNAADGVKDLKVESQVFVLQIEIRLRPRGGRAPRPGRGARPTGDDDAAAWPEGRRGVRGQARLGVVVRGVPGVRNDIATLLTLPIDTPTGCKSGCATWPT